jgi:glycosyltransferase involved in cell wall biosynthesis
MARTNTAPARLRVGFDARMVAYRQAGIGQYSLLLLRELAALQPDHNFDLVVYQSRKEKRPPADWLELPPGTPAPRKRILWTPPHHRLEQTALPAELLRDAPAVFHSPDFIPPLRRPTVRRRGPGRYASVITIHDLAFLRFPHLLTEESAAYYGQIRDAARRTEAIIAVSRSTARDVIEQLDVPEAKVHIVYEAANPLFRPLTPLELDRLAQGEAAKVAKKLAENAIAPAQRFLLFVSTIEPRKNLPTLLQAFRQMLDELDENADRPKLVIAGREGWLFKDVYTLAQELRLQADLVWLGGVSTDELLYLYNRAVVLAMPSLYEGFGLPPLEALACGTPVLVADVSSLPEVVGDYARKLPPENPAAWAEALSILWQNMDYERAKARLAGPAWAKNFSWRRAALETLAVYEEVGSKQ